MSWRCTCCQEIYGDNEVCPEWEAARKEQEENRIASLEERVAVLERAVRSIFTDDYLESLKETP